MGSPEIAETDACMFWFTPISREQALERLQAYAKKQELEKYSIQKMAHEEKKMNVFAKFLKNSFLLILNPAPNKIKGKARSKNTVGSN